MSRTLQLPILCLVTDLSAVGGNIDALIEATAAAVGGGVNMVQVRAPDLPDDVFLDLAALIYTTVGDHVVKILNPSARDFADVGFADGIQLPERASLNIVAARELAGPDALLGRSVHSELGAVEACRDGADFLVLGTVFASDTHPDGETLGLEGLHDVAAKVKPPVVAIGGISSKNATSVMSTGASGVAVVSAILRDPDPESAARRLLEALHEGLPSEPQSCA